MSDTPQEHASDYPSCIAVIVCGEIIEDKRTSNKTLVSLFHGIVVAQVPTLHPRMAVMASLTGARGKWPITFAIRAPSGKEVLRFDADAFFQDPLAVIDMSIDIQGLNLPELGVYYVDVMTGTYPLGHRRFTVYQGQTAPQQAIAPNPPAPTPPTPPFPLT